MLCRLRIGPRISHHLASVNCFKAQEAEPQQGAFTVPLRPKPLACVDLNLRYIYIYRFTKLSAPPYGITLRTPRCGCRVPQDLSREVPGFEKRNIEKYLASGSFVASNTWLASGLSLNKAIESFCESGRLKKRELVGTALSPGSCHAAYSECLKS